MPPWKGIAMVFGAFLVHLSLGTLYTFGNMAPYIASYYKIYLKHNIGIGNITWIFSAMIAAQGLLMIVGGLMERRLGPRLTSFIGCSIMSSGVLLTHFAINCDFIWTVATYGVLYGIGISFSYISLISCGMKWFPNQRGLVSGIIVAGFGLGALIFNPVQTQFLNPENILPNNHGYFTEEGLLLRVPKVFLLLGGIYGGMQIVGCSLASSPPSPKPVIINIDNEATFALNESGNKYINKNDVTLEPDGNCNLNITKKKISYTPLQFLKIREFYFMWLTFFFNAQTTNYLNAMYKIYGQTFIKDDLFLAGVGAIGAAFNATGRIGWGAMVDKFSYKSCLRMMLTVTLIFLLTLPATQLAGKYCYAVSICCLHISTSGSFVIFPAFVSKLFGSEYAGTNYGLIFSQMIIGGPITSILTSRLNDVFGFNGMFFMLAGFTVLSIILTIPFREELYTFKNVKLGMLPTDKVRK